MESPEEFTASNDHTLIIKGKRTKRPRPSSPFGPAAAVTSSFSSADGGYWSIQSPASSGEISTATDEDEDMANCLILLAQGGVVGSKQVEATAADEVEEGTTTATTTAGKPGFYVYECKTCNRTFPSFQALGGHRASHKKPKTTVEEKRSPLPISAPPSNHDDEEEESQFIKISPPLPLPIATKASQSHNNQNKSKVHECSICGSEFSSGQALGGHMRRHRAAPNTRTTMNVIDTSNTVIMESQEEEESEKPRHRLTLDLNLPAPLEDDHHHQVHHHRHRDTNKFQFTTTTNKPHLVFSAAALVDCHY